MNKTTLLAIAVLLLASCSSKRVKSNDHEYEDSIVYSKSSYERPATYPVERHYNLSDPEDILSDDDRLDLNSRISTTNHTNDYSTSNLVGKSVTVRDFNGNCYYIDVDGSGNLTAHDMNGYYYHSSTDELGYTSGYDSQGNFYHSYTDDYGNTNGYDSNGTTYHSTTDDFGYTNGYDSNGNSFSAYTDDLGNTTVSYY